MTANIMAKLGNDDIDSTMDWGALGNDLTIKGMAPETTPETVESMAIDKIEALNQKLCLFLIFCMFIISSVKNS